MPEKIEHISTAAPSRSSMDYAALRQEGVELIARYAGQTWTDYNGHDPGISFLEAFSYAMTDVAFRTQLDMADLIRSSEKNTASETVPAETVLPCAPVSTADIRKVLLDHYLINDASITVNIDNEISIYKDDSSDPPINYTSQGQGKIYLSGLYEVLLQFNNTEWNSNNYKLDIHLDNGDYHLDIALPYWDDQDATLFHEEVTLYAVTMEEIDSVIWYKLDEEQTYFAKVIIQYSSNPGDTVEIWLVLHIIEEAADPINDILDAATSAIESTDADSLIAQFANRVVSAHNGVVKIQHYLNSWRNLTEYPARLSVVRTQDIAVNARLEVNSGIDYELLLANIFMEIDLELSPPLHFSTLTELRNMAKTSSEIYDGPLLRNGFLLDSNQSDSSTSSHPSEIYTSDILRLIMRQRGGVSIDLTGQESSAGRDILAVSELTLSNYVNNRLVTKGATDCLRLVEVERYRPKLSLDKSQITIVRDDIEIQYDFLRVGEIFKQLRDEYYAAVTSTDPSSIWPVQQGEELPVADYYPYQNELPLIYGVGEAGLSEDAGVERKAQALQTKGYLLLTEQFLADVTATLANINRFFSPDANIEQTCFAHPIYDLQGVDALIKQYSPDVDWQTFIAAPDNPYSSALLEALEDRVRFLDRRNRMLDHLLARQGMESLAWSQEMHRRAYQELVDANIPPAEFPARLSQRQQDANATLIRTKAAFLADAPRLNATRLQAFGHPAKFDTSLISIVATENAYRWRLVLDNEELIQSVMEYATKAATMTAAEEAVILATQVQYYSDDTTGDGDYRYVLRDGPNSNDQLVGESIQTWSTIPQAQDALLEASVRFSSLRLESSLTSMERIIAYQSGLNPHGRRRLLENTNAYFEIYDEVDTDGIIEKRWRLWELGSYSGHVLLSSVYHFVAPPEIVDPTEQETNTIAQAEESIKKVIRYGINEWNYFISPAGTDTYNFELRDAGGNKIGLYLPPLPSVQATREAITKTVEHISRLYSTEGFHMIENILLRPKQDTDINLSIPISNTEKETDPYSQRIFFIFPSGYAQNFPTDPDELVREEVTPHRFRDKEFRRYMERVIQQTCPAHILPMIYWVDQQLPGNGNSVASFNMLEEMYFNWLEGILIPGIDNSTLTTNRTALIESLNGIANG